MTPGSISKRVVLDRLAWVERMVTEILALPLDDRQAFLADSRNIWTAESCLRRALEALFDLGRHILAKGFGIAASEYKEIANGLVQQDIFPNQDGDLLRSMAGYRNRLVHFYHLVEPDELFDICTSGLTDITHLAGGYRLWLEGHRELLDEVL